MVETKCFCAIGSFQFHRIFRGISFLVFLFLLYNQRDSLQNPFHVNLSSSRNQQWNLRGRGLPEISDTDLLNDTTIIPRIDPKLCSGLLKHRGFSSQCEYLIHHPECTSGGLFNYIRFLYCDCQKFPFVGYLVLGIWLLALFYLLGNTASDYFCCSLEKLSNLLKLPPTVAGVCLLPLGNGAPDVFASIAAFVGNDTGAVGLNSVLGGAVFVTCVVVGVVSICSSEKRIQIDRICFIRDICFFLFTLLSLGVVLIVGKVTVGVAIAFVSIYVIYAFAVAANEILRKNAWRLRFGALTPMVPIKGSVFSHGGEEDKSVYASLLGSDSVNDVPHLQNKLPHWMWASNVAIYSDEVLKGNQESAKQEWGWNEEETVKGHISCTCSNIFWVLGMPFTIVRRSTIPIIEEERWSKGFAVASGTLAPVLLALLWNTQDDLGILNREISYFIGVSSGGVLGVLAYLYTRVDEPPQKFLFPWAFGGFAMSIVWFYIIANELVALLVGLGVVFGINPALLGVTVLAWGNSMGDLMSNIALATHGGDSLQIAMSGCFAGPIFNTLVGLGLSMLLGAWARRPNPYKVPEDSSLFYTIGFLVLGLVWSLIILPRNDMRPNRKLGIGLLIIYIMFFIFTMATSMGNVLVVHL
ncbi:cation/calcium exchanger 4-like [Euphorbia lathyris]|uniref:cation/calcium exchanger 4-like n=1 Tax=Euphorbia lathyris TaxID=212925 RepID=UPI003313E766